MSVKWAVSIYPSTKKCHKRSILASTLQKISQTFPISKYSRTILGKCLKILYLNLSLNIVALLIISTKLQVYHSSLKQSIRQKKSQASMDFTSGKWPRRVESPLRTTVKSMFPTDWAAILIFVHISCIKVIACKPKFPFKKQYKRTFKHFICEIQIT